MRIWLVIPALLLLAPNLEASEQCLKVIFNQYCLGGDIKQQARQRPSPVHRQNEGDRLALIYQDGRDLVYVLGFKGRIYKVLRKYQSATRLHFEDLDKILATKYGKPEDRSYFPPYVRNPSSQLGAIRRGEGRSVKLWRPADNDWHIELGWTREMGITLAYIADNLDARRAEAEEKGF